MNITKKFSKTIAAVLAVVLLAGIVMANRLGDFSAATATITFDDVPNDWSKPYITTLAEKGVVSGVGVIPGVGNNCFNPSGNVAYAEMTKMVVNAFFRDEFNAYEVENASTMRTYFGNQLYWFSYMNYFANAKGLLNGISFDLKDYAACTAPMTRYDMAMLLYNAATKKGLTASSAEIAKAQSKLMDSNEYWDIIAYKNGAYKDAVLACYGMGLINGKGDLGFAGTDKMTRAEACKVIVVLDELVTKNGGSTVDPDPGTSEKPTPPVTATDGTLTNGKAITPDNVLEILNTIQAKYPHGTAWNIDTHNPNAVSATVTNMMASHLLASNAGCGGYASMVSDLIFGTDANPCRRLNSLDEVRPGDIILKVNANGAASHVLIVVDTVKAGDPAGRAGAIFYTDGNRNNQVNWPEDMTSEWASWNAYMPSQLGTCVAYTRYPA